MSLANRPLDPSKISFESHCFKDGDVVVEFRVLQSALKSGPLVFRGIGSEQLAIAAAKRANTHYTRTEYVSKIRVSWV